MSMRLGAGRPPRIACGETRPPAAARLLLLIALFAACAGPGNADDPPRTQVARASGATPTARATAARPSGSPAPATASRPAATELWHGRVLADQLRRGGYVIFIRHAATDFAQRDTDQQHLENCQTQRNLSPQGRADAERIGAGFQLLRIPLGPVLASPFCRTRETAQLAFGRFEATRDLLSLPAARDDADRQQLIAAFGRLLATPPPHGLNTILVGHDFSLQAVANLSVAEGEAAIFEPLGPNGFRLVGRVPHYSWTDLASEERDLTTAG